MVRLVPIGYLRPDPNQTVEDWVCSQTDPEQEEEKNFYVFDVLREFWMPTSMPQWGKPGRNIERTPGS